MIALATVTPGVDATALVFGFFLVGAVGLTCWGALLVITIFRRFISDAAD